MVGSNATTADEFLDEYLESISNLPAELNFNLTHLRDLDDAFHTLVDSMRSHAKSYAASYARSQQEDAPSTRSVLGDYRKDYLTVLGAAERKVVRSQAILDQFNAHLGRLERELTRFAKEDETSNLKRRRTTLGFDDGRDNVTPIRKRVKSSLDAMVTPSLKNAQSQSTVNASPRKGNGATTTSEDEALYCICRQVSYGDMVGCDNEGCEIEWFHYGCVGLVSPPKGKWYCTSCLLSGHGRAKYMGGNAVSLLDVSDPEFGEEDMKKVKESRRRRKEGKREG